MVLKVGGWLQWGIGWDQGVEWNRLGDVKSVFFVGQGLLGEWW